MIELTEMLAREEAGLTVDRALEDGPADVQSFQMFLSHEWRVSYLKLLEQLNLHQSRSNLSILNNNTRQGNHINMDIRVLEYMHTECFRVITSAGDEIFSPDAM